MKFESSLLKVSLVALSAIAAAAAVAACSTTDAGDSSAAAGTGATAGGTTGAGAGAPGASGSTTTTAGTGAGGSSGGATGGMGVACPTPTAAMAALLDFSLVDGGTPSSSFGDFTTTFSGSAFVYPAATQTPVPTYPLTVDYSGESWHVTGMVGDYSGMGIGFNNCNKVDLSGFTGITFSVSGSVAAPGTAANTLLFYVATAGDDVASAWLNSHKTDPNAANVVDNFGRCMPVNNQYDNTCTTPSYTVKVTGTKTTVNVKWADLVGGKPSATVNPSEITSIVWVIPPPTGAGTASPTPYALDVTLDDIALLP